MRIYQRNEDDEIERDPAAGQAVEIVEEKCISDAPAPDSFCPLFPAVNERDVRHHGLAQAVNGRDCLEWLDPYGLRTELEIRNPHKLTGCSPACDGTGVDKPGRGKRVLRGGPWSFLLEEVRSPKRRVDFPAGRSDDTGFRVLRALRGASATVPGRDKCRGAITENHRHGVWF